MQAFLQEKLLEVQAQGSTTCIFYILVASTRGSRTSQANTYFTGSSPFCSEFSPEEKPFATLPPAAHTGERSPNVQSRATLFGLGALIPHPTFISTELRKWSVKPLFSYTQNLAISLTKFLDMG